MAGAHIYAHLAGHYRIATLGGRGHTHMNSPPPLAVDHPSNLGVLRYYGRSHPGRAAWTAAPATVDDPYWGAGSHPDVVERVWDQLGACVPAACRCLLCGTPALVHDRAGIVLAAAAGTQYALRIPPDMVEAALLRGVRTHITWSYGGSMNTQSELGRDWVFGAYLPDEADWLRRTYARFTPPGTASDSAKPSAAK